jgi:hypothetical protein
MKKPKRVAPELWVVLEFDPEPNSYVRSSRLRPVGSINCADQLRLNNSVPKDRVGTATLWGVTELVIEFGPGSPLGCCGSFSDSP